MTILISSTKKSCSIPYEQQESVAQNDLEARLADYKQRIFHVCIDSKGKIYAKQLVNEEGRSQWVVFKKVYGVPNLIPLENKKEFLSNLSENGIPRLRFGELHVDFRLRGGMMAVASTVRSLSGFFTANSYRKLVQQTGAEARATIQVGGQEVRATIEKAEDSACRTISNCKYAVGSCLEKARTETSKVLEKTRQEMESVVATTGIEARHTSKHLAIQVEHLIGKAAIDTEFILSKAGQETRKTIQLGNQEARETSLLLSSEANKIIQSSGKEVDALIKRGSLEVRQILEQSARESKMIIEEAGEEFSIRSAQVINLALEKAAEVVTRLMQESEMSLSRLVDQVGREVNGIVLNLGHQGHLMIQDTGQEVRVTADHVLAKAFQGQEMIIKGFGAEARLTVEAFGKQVRSTLYEVPFIAGLTAEQVGRGLVHGLRSELLGSSQITTLVYKIERAMCSTKEISILELLNFIGQQNQSSIHPRDKVKLYTALIGLFNDPLLCSSEEARRNAFLLIGVTAIRDKDLKETTRSWTFSSQMNDLSNEVIKEIPGEEIRQALIVQGDKALAALEPVVEKVVLEQEIEQNQELFLELEQALDSLVGLKADFEKVQLEKDRLLLLNAEKDHLIESQRTENSDKEEQIQGFRQEISQLNKTVEGLKLEIDFLKRRLGNL